MEDTQTKWSIIFFNYIEQLEDYDSYYDFYEYDLDEKKHIEDLHEFSDKLISIDICKKILEQHEGTSSVCLYDERVAYRQGDYYVQSMEFTIDDLQKENNKE